MHADDSNLDGESDNETNISMLTESKSFTSQGCFLIIVIDLFNSLIDLSASSGLLLLAAAAEQKRRDEEGRIMFIIKSNQIIFDLFFRCTEESSSSIGTDGNHLSIKIK